MFKKSVLLFLISIQAAAIFANDNKIKFIKGNISDKTLAVKEASGEEENWLCEQALDFVLTNKEILGNDRELDGLAIATVLSFSNSYISNLTEKQKYIVMNKFQDLFVNFQNSATVQSTLINKIISLKKELPYSDFVDILNSYISKKGINNILYLPMLSHRPLQEEDLIRRAYVSFSSFTLSERTAIPITVEDKPNDGILRVFCNEYETAFLCPVFCLRTGNEEQTLQVRLPGRDGLLARRAIPYELPLKDFSPYIELFDYLFGKGKYPSEYLHFQRNTQEEMDALLEDRKILFKVYEQNYEYNFSFFLYSPARAQWNDNGYFNVLDGLHRCTYLMRKGKTSVPVAVNNGDFEKYKHFIHKNDK